jgi:hypothetical protein
MLNIAGRIYLSVRFPWYDLTQVGSSEPIKGHRRSRRCQNNENQEMSKLSIMGEAAVLSTNPFEVRLDAALPRAGCSRRLHFTRRATSGSMPSRLPSLVVCEVLFPNRRSRSVSVEAVSLGESSQALFEARKGGAVSIRTRVRSDLRQAQEFGGRWLGGLMFHSTTPDVRGCLGCFRAIFDISTRAPRRLLGAYASARPSISVSNSCHAICVEFAAQLFS